MNLYNESRPLRIFADGTEIAKENRIRVQGRSNMTLLPDFYLASIYNLSEEDITILNFAKKINITAEGNSLICCGEIESVYAHEEGTNEIHDVSISDGMTFWNASVDTSVGKGSWVKDSVRMILSGVEFGSFLCDDVRMPRGQVFSGRLADCVSTMARSLGARAFITKGVLSFIASGRSVNTRTLREDDLILNPKIINGGMIVKTKVGGYSVGEVIEYGNAKYRVVSQGISLDNFSGDWNTEMILINEKTVGMEGGW